MNPAASSASSECRMSAMLMAQPGRKRVKNSGNHMIRPGRADDGHAPEHGEVIELLPIRPAVELRLRALAEEPFVVVNQVCASPAIVGTIESGPNSTEKKRLISILPVSGLRRLPRPFHACRRANSSAA